MLYKIQNPFAEESWEILARRFINEFATVIDDDVDPTDPDSLYGFLLDQTSEMPDLSDTDELMQHIACLWLMNALEDNGPRVWVAGYNQVGYAANPDDVDWFFHRSDAADFLAQEVRRDQAAWDEADNEVSPTTPFTKEKIGFAFALGVQARRLKAEDEVGVEINGTYYWIQRRSINAALVDLNA